HVSLWICVACSLLTCVLLIVISLFPRHLRGELLHQSSSSSCPLLSENLLDEMNRSVRAYLPDADCNETIEERVLRHGGLEARHRAEVMVRVVAHTGERHVNQAFVVGLE